MKSNFFFVFVFSSFTLFSQNRKDLLVKDSLTGEAIDFATITSKGIEQYTNADGKFNTLIGEKICIEKPGYISNCFLVNDNLNVVLLSPKIYNIEEVIIEKYPSILKNAFWNLEKNYSFSPYNEEFDLRVILRKNNEINKLEDISGIYNRKLLFATNKIEYPKENFIFQIFNLRKVGTKENKIDYEFFSLDKLLTSFASVYVDVKNFNFSREETKTKDVSRLTFNSKKQDTKGYYYINNEDFAISEFYIDSKMNNSEYKKKGNIEYRTISYTLNTFFDKNPSVGKYTISSAKLTTIVEIKMPTGNKIQYTCEYNYIGRNSFNNLKINSNVSSQKDIFELRGNYNESLFNSNKNLSLTNEMQNFIDKARNSPKNYEVNK